MALTFNYVPIAVTEYNEVMTLPLSSVTPEVYTDQSHQSSSSAPVPAVVAVNPTEPITSLQIRLADGTR